MEFVLTALPPPRQVSWQGGKRVHLAESEGARTLCGLAGDLRPARAGIACAKCRVVASSRARVARLMKTD